MTTITVTEAARILGLSRQRVHRLLESGQLVISERDDSFPGGRYLLDRDAVERFADERNGR